ncbi:cyclin-dependent protein kinase inhibitor SMR1-like [Mercurialis annua]|uniref:cyclin-dependent protein kinase inhibitor SMR1-like n=1 Tax=Mercurialis annua TaxID=3986 RepID=UPI00215EB607|nr:cyclin-dependent protein kinase inhibitor SMR1-like [Mercurialis annua]
MSTTDHHHHDLEFRQDSPRKQVPFIKNEQLEQSCSSSNENKVEIQQQNNEEDCTTPTSDENKIPPVVICPPAPRKPKTMMGSCKRKLDFLEIVKREEVESYFRSNFDVLAKRRCPCK